MCGRYYAEDNFLEEIEGIIKDLEIRLEIEDTLPQVKTGEIYPTDEVLVFIREGTKIKLELLKWGFPNSKDGKTIINARSETVEEKQMFRESFCLRRCVIPSSGFFEWKKNKEKIYFTLPEDSVMYMAGVFKIIENEMRFVILTTNANGSIEDVHHRMPLILLKEKIKPWILDDEKAREILGQNSSRLNRSSDYEQQTLDLF